MKKNRQILFTNANKQQSTIKIIEFNSFIVVMNKGEKRTVPSNRTFTRQFSHRQSLTVVIQMNGVYRKELWVPPAVVFSRWRSIESARLRKSRAMFNFDGTELSVRYFDWPTLARYHPHWLPIDPHVWQTCQTRPPSTHLLKDKPTEFWRTCGSGVTLYECSSKTHL